MKCRETDITVSEAHILSSNKDTVIHEVVSNITSVFPFLA